MAYSISSRHLLQVTSLQGNLPQNILEVTHVCSCKTLEKSKKREKGSYTLLIAWTNALIQIWKSTKISVFISKQCVGDFTFEIRARKICEKLVYKHSEKIGCWKLANFLRDLQNSRANKSQIFWSKTAKFSWYCYRNTNIKRDFQICISVPLWKIYYLVYKYYKPIFRFPLYQLAS